MIFIYILITCIVVLLLALIKKIDVAIELIYNRLNIDTELWGGEYNE